MKNSCSKAGNSAFCSSFRYRVLQFTCGKQGGLKEQILSPHEKKKIIRETSLPHFLREVPCHSPGWGKSYRTDATTVLVWALDKVLPDASMQKHWVILNPSIYLSFPHYQNEKDLRFIRKDNFATTSSTQALLYTLLFTMLGLQANQPFTWVTLRLHEKEGENWQQHLSDSLQHISHVSSQDDH